MQGRYSFLKRPKVALETMGCKLNLADTEILAQEFRRAGFQVVPPDGDLDVFVLNTCTVTHVADRKARHAIRAARRRFQRAFLIATGCYAQRAAHDLQELSEVDLVLGNTEKQALVERVVAQFSHRWLFANASDSEGLIDEGLPLRTAIVPNQTRAFVKIQEGCNDYCSFCIIPKTRGASRFFSPDQVVAAVQEREAAGYQEVVLTGTQLGDYGIDAPGSRRRGPDLRDQGSQGGPLALLLKRVLRESGISRIRLSSIQPQDVTPDLLDLWQDDRLCRHFHVPLQSGSDSILDKMRRRYTAGEFVAAVLRIRAALPDVSITTDVIVGFPGEGEADFAATRDLCNSLVLADIHVFPYSPRQGTLAARWTELLPDAVKQERVHNLMAMAQRSKEQHQQHFVGTVRPVLWEERKHVRELAAAPLWHGLTDNYVSVYANYPGDITGAIYQTRLVSSGRLGILGEPVL